VALTLIRHFIDKGYAVDLLLMRATGELLPLVPQQVRVIDLDAKRIRNLVWPVAKYLAKVRPAALQISMWPLTVAGILARILSRSNARIIVSDHAALSRQYARRGSWHREVLKWSIRHFYPRADARVVVATATAKDLSLLSGLPVEDFRVIYNPVEPPSDVEVDPEIARLWGNARRRILNVGNLKPEKNQHLLLESFARISTGRDAKLIILGDGPLRQELERRAMELGIADRVIMPGFRLDPTPFYRSADLFVMSSDYEGYPLVLIEAMYCGVPIVSTDCPTGPAEILNWGEFGTLTPCGNSQRLAEAMAAALESPANPERLIARASELSGHTADRYLQLMTMDMDVET
jgi:glycosyltransferase involved in cell wall biosynthesis